MKIKKIPMYIDVHILSTSSYYAIKASLPYSTLTGEQSCASLIEMDFYG